MVSVVVSGAGLSVGEAGQATALVVDAEVTSILMMGALSPGLKRHSVTLFEGSSTCTNSHLCHMCSDRNACLHQALVPRGISMLQAGQDCAAFKLPLSCECQPAQLSCGQHVI